MVRILITGKNCELSREAFSRAARLACEASHETGRAASYSGVQPESAPGGTRAMNARKDNRTPVPLLSTPDLEHPIPTTLEVHPALAEVGLVVIVCFLSVAVMVVSWL